MKIKTDTNHFEVAGNLQTVGVQVKDCSAVGGGFPDLLACWQRIVTLIEVKFGKDAVILKSQMKFISEWKGYVGFAENFAEAERLAKDPVSNALTQKQKDRIAAFLVRFQGEKMLFSTFKKEVLG